VLVLLFSEDFKFVIALLAVEVVVVALVPLEAVAWVLVFHELLDEDGIEKVGIEIFVIDGPPLLELLELLDDPRLPPLRLIPTPDAPAAAAPGIVASGIIITPAVERLGDGMEDEEEGGGPLVLPPPIAEGAMALILTLLSAEDDVIRGEFLMTLPIDCRAIAETTLPEGAIPAPLLAPRCPALPLLGIVPECIGIVFAGQDALGTEEYTGPKLAMDCPMS
jgi:hypothetical protein